MAHHLFPVAYPCVSPAEKGLIRFRLKKWSNRVCLPSDQNWTYYPGDLFLRQVTAIHVKIGHLQISSTHTLFSNKLITFYDRPYALSINSLMKYLEIVIFYEWNYRNKYNSLYANLCVIIVLIISVTQVRVWTTPGLRLCLIGRTHLTDEFAPKYLIWWKYHVRVTPISVDLSTTSCLQMQNNNQNINHRHSSWIKYD